MTGYMEHFVKEATEILLHPDKLTETLDHSTSVDPGTQLPTYSDKVGPPEHYRMDQQQLSSWTVQTD
jgi:hypothetical protein